MTRATRCIVVDGPGLPTALQLYRDDVMLAEVLIDTATCVGLAADLLSAARIRLGRAPDRWPTISRTIKADPDEGGRR